MKTIILIAALLINFSVAAQKNISISFKNDYQDVYHLSLILYTPDGKSQTRVGDLKPGAIKTYTLPEKTEIYIADYKQEAFAMKGNDIKASGAKPTLVLSSKDDGRTILLSTLGKNEPPVTKTPASASSLFGKVLANSVAAKKFSGTVLVARNGKILFQQSAGLANRADNIVLTNNSKYRIASITKTFTAVLVLQLMEQGRLDLKKTIGHYLPAYTGAARDKATIHHLLTYSSGIENVDQGSEAMYAMQLPTDSIIKKYCSGPLVHEPGAQMNYKNAEYIILGKIIEAITGKPYETVLQENILTPLQMKHTGYLLQKDIVPGLANSYTTDSTGRFYNEDPFWIENFYSSGSLYSTAADLYKFDQDLFTNKLLKKTTVDLMTTSYPELWGVAYSFWVSDQKIGSTTVKAMDRRGSISGNNAAWFHFIGRNETIIVLSNSNAADVVELRQQLAEALLGR
jgi:teichoic acid D-alanine hydrolase